MTPRSAANLRAGDRVLITRLDYLGDVVLSLPLVDAIAEAHPGIEIDYLTRRPAADLLAGEGRFARVFALERGAGVGESVRMIRSLRSRGYSAVVDLYSNPRSAWLSWLTGARVRIGGKRRGRRHLYTHAVPGERAVRAATECHLRYANVLGVNGTPRKPTLAMREDELERARGALRAAGAEGEAGRCVVGIHPGGKWSVKRWATARFAELVALVRERLDARVVVLTGPGEERYTDALRRIAPETAVYLPAMPVREAAAAIATLDAMVACDGGAMHVSVAVGTPTVGIFGSAEPEVWFPYEDFGPYRAAYLTMECRPCHRHECPLGHTDCLNALGAETVLGEVVRVMNESARMV